MKEGSDQDEVTWSMLVVQFSDNRTLYYNQPMCKRNFRKSSYHSEHPEDLQRWYPRDLTS
jgi:hypothetical protein